MLIYRDCQPGSTTSFDYSMSEDEISYQRGDLISWNFEPGQTSYWVLVEEDEDGIWKIARASSINIMDTFAEKANVGKWNPQYTGLDKIHKCKPTGFDVQAGQRWTAKIRGRDRQMIIKDVTGELVVAELCRKTSVQDTIYISKGNLARLAKQVKN